MIVQQLVAYFVLNRYPDVVVFLPTLSGTN